MMEYLLKRKRGITLIALVITVVVMLILAGVAISAIVGGEGLFSKARQAAEIYENASKNENDIIQNLIEQIDEGINGGMVSDGEDKITVKLSEGMVPVTYNERDSRWYVATEEEIKNNSWFKYVDTSVAGQENQSKWANVMLKDNLEIEGIIDASTSTLEEMYGKKVISEGSMYVWIPRYAYRITSGYHTNQTGEISIKFLNTDNTYKDENFTEPLYIAPLLEENINSSSAYIVHPAFSWEKEDGTEVELEGIWVGKFEASASNTNFEAIPGENVQTSDSVILRTVGNVSSWRSINRNNIFLNCYNMNSSNNASIYGISTNKDEIDPHLIKNTEWGATAYLAHSVYGRNATEVTANENVDHNTGSGDYKLNVTMSTTGNVYGIYDMSGGAWEHVAAYVDSTKGGSVENTYLISEEYGKALYEAKDKYKNVYITATEDNRINNYMANVDKYGDAMYETSFNTYDGINIDTLELSWFGDRSTFSYTDRPFINRGGAYGDDSKNGLFAFADTTGRNTQGDSFRSALTVM